MAFFLGSKSHTMLRASRFVGMVNNTKLPNCTFPCSILQNKWSNWRKNAADFRSPLCWMVTYASFRHAFSLNFDAATTHYPYALSIWFDYPLGAGVFVTTVVAGSIAVTHPFKLAERPFLRDVIFYIAAAFWTFTILYRREIVMAEAIGESLSIWVCF